MENGTAIGGERAIRNTHSRHFKIKNGIVQPKTAFDEHIAVLIATQLVFPTVRDYAADGSRLTRQPVLPSTSCMYIICLASQFQCLTSIFLPFSRCSLS